MLHASVLLFTYLKKMTDVIKLGKDENLTYYFNVSITNGQTLNIKILPVVQFNLHRRHN